jgi:ATPases of the AAA+ class
VAYFNVNMNFSSQVADMFSKFYGEAEFRLKAAFDAALDHAPSLLLLDNLDVLCTGRNR